MRIARARYHKAVKDIFKKNEDELHRRRTAEAVSANHQCHLWNEVDKMTPSGGIVSCTFNGKDSNVCMYVFTYSRK